MIQDAVLETGGGGQGQIVPYRRTAPDILRSYLGILTQAISPLYPAALTIYKR